MVTTDLQVHNTWMPAFLFCYIFCLCSRFRLQEYIQFWLNIPNSYLQHLEHHPQQQVNKYLMSPRVVMVGNPVMLSFRIWFHIDRFLCIFLCYSVKLSIKSFKVPELFIEIPATATVGSLKVCISFCRNMSYYFLKNFQVPQSTATLYSILIKANYLIQNLTF